MSPYEIYKKGICIVLANMSYENDLDVFFVPPLLFVSINLTFSCGFLGLCKVDETPKGWYIQYIDRDPETIRRQQEQERKKKQDLDDEEKTAKFIEQQVRRGLEGKELVRKIAL